MVGEHLVQHHKVVQGRLDRHEVGNHTWSHTDLSEWNFEEVTSQLHRTHEAIIKYTGKQPRFMRPPWGHLGGSTVLAANALDYNIVLWSQQMREKKYKNNPEGNTRQIVEGARPGSIILAHDYGDSLRLVALNHLDAIIEGLRNRGFTLVTVSQLLEAHLHAQLPDRPQDDSGLPIDPR